MHPDDVKPPAGPSAPVTSSIRWIVVGLLAGVPMAALPVRAQVVQTPAGFVEFIGLEEWTAERLVDSLTASAPDLAPTLYPTALAGLGFPRARAERILVPLEVVDSVQIVRQVTLVTVVEARHAEELELSSGFSQAQDLPARWASADSIFRLNNPTFVAAVGLRLFRETDPALAESLRQGLGLQVQQERAREAWDALDALDSAADLESGLTVLAEDQDAGHRALAASIVAGFPSDDRAWYGLVTALLDSSGRVTAVVNQVVGSMATAAARPIDWAGATDVLHSLIAGANLSAVPTLMQVLVSTEVSTDLAAALLAGNGHLVLGHLGSEYSPHRDVAHRFLVQIRGEDLGEDPESWREWVEGL